MQYRYMAKNYMKQQITTTEIIEHEDFRKEVANQLSLMIARRQIRPQPKAGFKYSRDWYDRLEDENNLKPAFFLQHINDIWHKVSKLNSQTREIILFICNMALSICIKKWEKENETKTA